jgi:hypothetical protein
MTQSKKAALAFSSRAVAEGLDVAGGFDEDHGEGFFLLTGVSVVAADLVVVLWGHRTRQRAAPGRGDDLKVGLGRSS